MARTPFSIRSRWSGLALMALACVVLAACTNSSNITPSHNHLLRTTPPTAAPPQSAPEPTPVAEAIPDNPDEVYTISVTEMPVRDLLFAMARDANMNIDIYPGITGRVTLSAVNQNLPQILDRIAKQVDLRYEIQGKTIVVMPDRPYMKIYQVDYVHMNRSSTSSIRVSTQLSTGVGTANNPLGFQEANQSSTEVTNTVNNQFWTTLVNNIRAILGQEALAGVLGTKEALAKDKEKEKAKEDLLAHLPVIKEGGFDNPEALTPTDGRTGIVAANPEAGLIGVYASAQQHARIQELLNNVLDNAQRQVIIESTVVEVELDQRYQEGVDWNNLFHNSLNLTANAAFTTKTLENTLAGAQALSEIGGAGLTKASQIPFFTATLAKAGHAGAVNATIHALQEYGKVKVLSSPKITAINNQTAIMKVVENKVFFTIEAQVVNQTTQQNNQQVTNPATPIYNSKVHTVPVGLVLSVTPQISKDDVVNLNVRPTISRISGWAVDPNPGLQPNTLLTGVANPINNRIPEIQVREMESMLRIQSGQVAVMGGLMQDRTTEDSTGLPTLSQLPVVGPLFGFKDEHVAKTELVIFMRPVVTTLNRPKPVQQAAAPRPQPAPDFVTPNKVPPPGGPFTDDDLKKGVRPKPASGPNQSQLNNVPTLTTTAAPKGGKGSKPAASGRKGAPAKGGAPSAASLDRVYPTAPTAAPADPEVGVIGVDRSNGAPPAPVIPAGRRVSQNSPAPRAGSYFVDLGAYVNQENADKVRTQAAGSGLPILREEAVEGGRTHSRVLAGPFASQGEADQAKQRLRQKTGLSGTVAVN